VARTERKLMDWLRRAGGGTNRRPLLKRDIEDAQRNTLSAHEAARWIGVSYTTYKKYAKLYGLHEQHLNPGGKGIPKPHVEGKRFPLSDILEGKHPSYNVHKLKERLIKTAYLDEQCSQCGFDERRILDYKKPLMLVFKDGNSTNHKLDNMYLLCFNCAFLTVGNLNNINPYKIKRLSEVKDETALKGDDTVMGLSDDELNEVIAEAREELNVDSEGDKTKTS